MEKLKPVERKFFTNHEVELMLKSCKGTTDRFTILYLADTGARISEGLMSRLEHMDVFKKKVYVPTLKGRTEIIKLREIDMSERLREEYILYWRSLKVKDKDSFLFQAPDNGKEFAISRQAIDIKLKRITKAAKIEIRGSAHKFRHSFGTRLAEAGTKAHVIKELMGHKKIENTYIYIHAVDEYKKLAIENINTDSWWTKIKRKFWGENPTGMLPTDKHEIKYLIGRSEDLDDMLQLGKKRQNLLLIGKGGVGKTTLLNHYKYGKVMRLQDLKGGNKKVLGNILNYLFNGDKNEVLRMLYGEEVDGMDVVINKEKENELMKLIIKITRQGEYTLIIDSLDQLTKTTAKLIEVMKSHFHIIAAARSVKVDYNHTFSNFRVKEIKAFSRAETTLFVEKLTARYQMHISDFEVLKNHVYNETGGNPQYIMELVRAYEAEGSFDVKTILNLKHTAGRRQIDMTFFYALGLSCLMLLRYLGTEMGADAGAYRLIGGAAMIFCLFARQFVTFGKKRTIGGY